MNHLKIANENDESDHRLAQLGRAEQMLAEIASIKDATDIIDFAEAARVYAREAKLGTSAVNYATVIKLRAERKLADMVDEGQKVGQIATPTSTPGGVRTPDTTTLDELGVQRQRLSEARKIRDAFSDEELMERAQEASARDEPMTRRQVLRDAGMKVEESPQTDQDYAASIVRKVESACQVLASHDRRFFLTHVRATGPENVEIVKKQLRMARIAIEELEKELR